MAFNEYIIKQQSDCWDVFYLLIIFFRIQLILLIITVKI